MTNFNQTVQNVVCDMKAKLPSLLQQAIIFLLFQLHIPKTLSSHNSGLFVCIFLCVSLLVNVTSSFLGCTW